MKLLKRVFEESTTQLSRQSMALEEESFAKLYDNKESGWIGVDLDGTLAHYDGWKGIEYIGEPVAPMVQRVQQWLNEGREVKIFTARAYHDGSKPSLVRAMQSLLVIKAWCRKHIGRELAVTFMKDPGMVELWDDRARQVKENTGEVVE